MSSSAKKSAASLSGEKRRGPGRPPNSERIKGGRVKSTEKRRVGRPSLSDKQSQSPEKRGRGRPPSIGKGRISGRAGTKQVSPVDSKRGRGRPSMKKTDAGRGVSTARPSDTGERRGPGRPRKSIPLTPTSEDVTSPKRIRPVKRSTSPGDAAKGSRVSPRTPKADEEDSVPEASEDDDVSSIKLDGDETPSQPRPVQRSRSGRMVKRSAFHDEIDEGEQHLRSAKAQSLLLSPKTPNAPQPMVVESSTAPKEIEPLTKPPVVVTVPNVPKAPILSPVVAQIVKQPIAASNPPQSTINVVQVPAPPPQPVPEAPAIIPKQPQQPPVVVPPPAKTVVPPVAPPIAPPSMPPKKAPNPVVTPAPAMMPPPPLPPPPPPTAVVKSQSDKAESAHASTKVPRRKPGARECMQISRRFGAQVIPQKYMTTLMVRKTARGI